MTADYDGEAVLAQVAQRRAGADAWVAEHVDLSPEAVWRSWLETERGRQAKRAAKLAERAGRLNLGADR